MTTKVVRILGNASNLALMPPTPSGWEVWACNQKRGYNKWLPRIIDDSEWTRWFNLHSRKHMLATYPRDFGWYFEQTKPIYFQKHQPDIPTSHTFPRQQLQAYFPDDGHYFTCSAAWLIALAIYEGFDRIELWGIEIAKRKWSYSWERPCMFYWIRKAESLGIEVWRPDGLDWDLSEAGSPADYIGPLYGFDTKPEVEDAPS
jgi:hypothetical protein